MTVLGSRSENRYSKWLFLLALFILSSVLLIERRELLVYGYFLAGTGEPPELLPAQEEGANVRWFDNYFTVEEVASKTWAIGEPRYYQQNYSYLIVGDERALLFDAGPGIRDIRKVAESLTDKPIVFLPSHFHYDHVGNDVTFDEIAVVDLPYLRAREENGALRLTDMEHAGAIEGFESPTWQVDYWWAPGAVIELGQRQVTIHYTPGHTTDSISLLDSDNRIFFSGDYLYPGELYAFLTNSSMGDYLSTAESLIHVLDDDIRILGAHRVSPPGAPTLATVDLKDLRRGLIKIRDGQLPGSYDYPARFPLNDRLSILAEPRWLQRW